MASMAFNVARAVEPNVRPNFGCVCLRVSPENSQLVLCVALDVFALPCCSTKGLV